jgi:hypothetical protein
LAKNSHGIHQAVDDACSIADDHWFFLLLLPRRTSRSGDTPDAGSEFDCRVNTSARFAQVDPALGTGPGRSAGLHPYAISVIILMIVY